MAKLMGDLRFHVYWNAREKRRRSELKAVASVDEAINTLGEALLGYGGNDLKLLFLLCRCEPAQVVVVAAVNLLKLLQKLLLKLLHKLLLLCRYPIAVKVAAQVNM
ncbi:hypothetical protein Dimus_011786 [Dionaea muscipula]